MPELTRKNIAIVSFEGDLHALIIRHALGQYPDVDCHVIEVDRLCGGPSLTWDLTDTKQAGSAIVNREGAVIPIETLDVIWWRRTNTAQRIPPEVVEGAHRDVINRSCSAALLGTLYTEFSGIWINNPSATELASNKVVQLRAAKKAGFRVPQTLVTQDPHAIRRFDDMMAGDLIVKTVEPTSQANLFARKLTRAHLAGDAAIMLCPTIYQEFIPGQKHLRVNCFGKDTYAILLENPNLDWREDLSGTRMSVVELDEKTKQGLYQVCEELDLEMGIFDLKLDPGGTAVWLEVNPQGQFLFIQGLIGLDLASAFAAFLYDRAVKANSRGISLDRS